MKRQNQLKSISEIFGEDYYHNNKRNYSWAVLGHQYRQTAQRIKNVFLPGKLLDVGCAKGFMVKALLEIGIDAGGIDASEYAIGNAVKGIEGRISRGLIQALPYKAGEYDTVLAFDILEHIPEEDADEACAELMRVTNRLLIINVITLEVPDYNDSTHITIKPKQWWVDKLLQHGGELIPYENYGAPVWWLNVPERSIVIKKLDYELARVGPAGIQADKLLRPQYSLGSAFLSQNKKSLSLAMIVKDEEKCIKRCLDSVKDLVDEIVIVDTGSTDKTIEICRSYNALVFSYPWNNHFAEARNFGLDKVMGEWVLWLDADEEVAQENRNQLNNHSIFNDYDALSVPLINFYGETVDFDQVAQIAQPRFFRNHMGFRFENKIHEWLNVSSAYERDRVGFLDLKIYHYGYMNAQVEDKQKFNRNVNLLLQELEEEKNHAWTHYYLSAEYYRRREFKKAFEHVNQSILLFIKDGTIPPPSMLYSLKYSILIETMSWEGAWPSIKSAVKMFPDYVDLKFYMGVILYYRKMYPEALACFEECLELGESNFNYLSLKGLGSFRAWYFKGLCFEELKNEEEAILAYLKALIVSNSFTPAREALVKLINKQPSNFVDYVKNRFKPEEADYLLRISLNQIT
ncbi:MAG: glycosyltransferase [Syntrophomonadaceae bacterium]|nr:glycosyltransferase [Syntrophomonadaceae bacterium]